MSAMDGHNGLCWICGATATAIYKRMPPDSTPRHTIWMCRQCPGNVQRIADYGWSEQLGLVEFIYDYAPPRLVQAHLDLFAESPPFLIKGLSLTQPWATLAAIGAKRIETRGKRTAWRGPIAIQAAQRFPEDAQIVCGQEPFRSVLAAAGYHRPEDLPRQAILSVGRLTDCLPIISPPLDAIEASFGLYTLGRWAWHLSDMHLFAEPIPAPGAIYLWDATPTIQPYLSPQLQELVGRWAADIPAQYWPA